MRKHPETFDYDGTPYRVAGIDGRRWTNSGYVTRVYAVNTTTGLGGRYFDLWDDGKPCRFSPD